MGAIERIHFRLIRNGPPELPTNLKHMDMEFLMFLQTRSHENYFGCLRVDRELALEPAICTEFSFTIFAYTSMFTLLVSWGWEVENN